MHIVRLLRRCTTLLTVVGTLTFGLGAVPSSAATVAAPRGAVLAATSDTGVGSLETAATRASDLGRTIAFSLIGLALAVAAVVLVFRRDFKEAIGLLVIGAIAVLLASPVGLAVLKDTVATLFGSS